MNHKKTMSDDEARKLILFIKIRTRGLPGSTDYDYFHKPVEVCELVESTLLGLGYDPDWVVGPFDRMLVKEVERNRTIALGNFDKFRTGKVGI